MASIGTSRRGLHSRSDLPMNADINVTSLVDVAFTLLVIFIITAPILQGGIEVGIPRADVPPLTAQDEPFIITVRQDGSIVMEETPVTITELEEGLPQLLAASGLQSVIIRADSIAPYGIVLRVMATAFNNGVRPSLVAEPYRGR
jgi:biopolymer transport protein ExbD/biopolymer transport protein TolR